MNNFWDIVGFEYKKIVYKRTFIIATICLIATVIFSILGMVMGSEYIDGKAVRSSYEGVQMDIANARSFAGRKMDSEFIKEARAAYGMLPKDEPRYTTTEEYTTYARKYTMVYGIMRQIFLDNIYPEFGFTVMQNLTDEEIDNFYTIRSEWIKDEILKKSSLNDKSKAKLLAMNEKVETPFAMGSTEGYDRYLALIYTSGLVAGFLVIVSLAPIFSDEYKSASAIILASKNGKKSLIKAKIFTGLTLSVIIALVFYLVTYIGCMLIYGTDGVSLPIQLISPTSVYNMSFGDMAVIVTITATFGCVLFGAITMLLSSKLKNSAGVIAIMTLILVAPMFISISEDIGLLHRLVMLFPSNMLPYWNSNSEMLFEIFGLSIEPYIFSPMFAIIASGLMMPFAYRNFKNHQAI